MSDSSDSKAITRRGFIGRAGASTGALAFSGLALDACGSSKKKTSVAKSGGGGSESLTIAVNGTQSVADALQKGIGTPFEQAHKGTKINFMAINGIDWNDYFAKVLTLIAAGNAPDLTNVATEGLQLFAAKGLAEPLDSYVTRDKTSIQSYFADVHPLLIEAMMYQGQLYVLPTDFNCGNMFFDAPLMQKAGLTVPSADWTQSDFEAMAQKLSKAGGQAVAWDWVVRLWGSWSSWMYANDANLLTEGKWPGGSWMWDTFYKGQANAKGRKGGYHWGDPTADSSATVEALQYMVDLKKSGLSTSPDVGGGATLQGLFASNHIGMTIGGGFWAGGLTAAGMKKGQFEVQYFPSWKVQKMLVGTAGYAMFKSAPNKDLAWEFLKSIVSQQGIDAVCYGNVTTPSRRSMCNAARYAKTGPTNYEVFYGTLDKYPNTTPIPAPPYYQQLATAFIARTTSAMTGGDARPALQGLQSDLEGYAKSSPS